VILEELVLSESGSANGALVGKVGGFESFSMIFGHVVEQLPLVHLYKKGVPSVKETLFQHCYSL